MHFLVLFLYSVLHIPFLLDLIMTTFNDKYFFKLNDWYIWAIFWTMTIIGFMKRIFIYKHSNDHLNWSHRCDVMTIRCATRYHVLCSFIFNILMVINIFNIFQIYLLSCFQYEYLSFCFFCMKSVGIPDHSTELKPNERMKPKRN